MTDGNRKRTVLVIDDDRVFCESVKEYLAGGPVEVLAAHTAADGLAFCASRVIDVVLLDQQLPDAEGYTLCPAILKSNEQTKIIFTTAFPSFENAVKAIRGGAYDYLSKPFQLEELGLALKQAMRTLELEGMAQIQDYHRTRESESAVVIAGPEFAGVMRLVDLAAASESPVLITGETGTGKSLVAKAIHYRGKAASLPFIGINCASLPENLIEAELFGYEKGAFTGAVTARKGIFEMAEGGTLFLDEVGEIPLHLQAKLLSAIEEKRIRRLGGEALRPVQARIIAATNAQIEEALGKTFRKDLYYRLSVVRIHLPPLRERRGDVPELCRHLLKEISGGREAVVRDAELEKLGRYDWPGNVRELKNVLERAYLLQGGSDLRPAELLGAEGDVVRREGPATEEGEEILPLEIVENRHIRQVLDRLSGNYTKAAKALGISLSTLKRKVKTLS